MKYSLMLRSLLSFLLIFSLSGTAAADQSVIARWSQVQKFSDRVGGELEIRATYYSAEYIEALVQEEAQKNLWTADEVEQYKYQMLKTLTLDEYIPIHIAFDNRGPAMRMAPFDKMLTLWIGKAKLVPADYDKRFNFRLEGKRDGLVYFPRYDDKGNPYLKNAKTIRLSLSNAVSSVVMNRSGVDFFWDVQRDNPEVLYKGRAASRLELDRLIKRIEKLTAEKRDLENKLNGINAELVTINQRVEELQKQ